MLDMRVGDWYFLEEIGPWPLAHTFLPFFLYVFTHEGWFTLGCVFLNEFFELILYNSAGSYMLFPQEGKRPYFAP